MSRERPRAKDLSRERPAPRHRMLSGYPWLPRIIDKARASAAGTLGDYSYPCPIDATFLRAVDMSADDFRELAAGSSEQDIVTALRARRR